MRRHIVADHSPKRKTIDFIDTVLGPSQDRHVDFLTIHPRTRSTPSTTPIFLEALELLTNKYGDRVPTLVSGDVFSMGSLPYTSPYLPPRDGEESRPHLPKLRGLMAARGLLANPALFAGYEACPWEAVEVFMNNVVRAPLPVKLVQHHRTLSACASIHPSVPVLTENRILQWARCARPDMDRTGTRCLARRSGWSCTTAQICVT